METFTPLLALIAFAFFASRRLPRYLHIFQQDEYDGRRFLRWISTTRAFDKRVTLALLLGGIARLLLANLVPHGTGSLIYAVLFALFAAFEPDPKKEAKKKLVMTSRARRIFGTAFVLCLLAGGLASQMRSFWAWVFMVQAIPFLLALANVLLSPLEASIQRRILNEAMARLKEVDPVVVGITGSFGKTSAKHILGHILEMHAPTLFTPGSVNTPMGVSRIIRENLRNDCRFFLVEMGAYGQGSIARLCRLTPPQTGIITAIGEAHYERFKSLDTVARAKFELAEAVLGNELGRIVIHEDALDQDYARAFVEKKRDCFVICGKSPSANLIIESVEQTVDGLTVQVRWKDQIFALMAPLFGKHHAGNMSLAFAAAVALGVPPERAVTALRTTPQITHRLEVKPQPDGTTLIDDAYNANPHGFSAALELMTMLAAEAGGRRILVTPGVAELGAMNDEVHRKLGAESARHADVALVIRPDRIPSFAESFRAQEGAGLLVPLISLAEAQAWIKENAKPKDVILLENDLPDVLERRLRL
jgi:UDP-N-acetylmuramoyl-tripeptide--D-alanyl-D-alanine ligase